MESKGGWRVEGVEGWEGGDEWRGWRGWMSGREEMSDAKFVEPFFADWRLALAVMLQSFSNTIFMNFASAYSIAKKNHNT